MSDVRDIRADYLAAHLEEYRRYLTGGDVEQAAAVAEVLRESYDYKVESPRERAVDTGELETAVEKPRRGRPKKSAGA